MELYLTITRTGGDQDADYEIGFKPYKASVTLHETLKWNVTIVWETSIKPLGPFSVAIFGFVPHTPGTPLTPFPTDPPDRIAAYGKELEQVGSIYTTIIESDAISVSPKSGEQYEWAYTIYILGHEGVLGRVDPLVVVSG